MNRITKDLLIYLPAQALPALAAIITVSVYTRLFSPAEFGNYVLAVSAQELLMLATITGFGQAAVRFFSAYKLRSGLSSYFATIFGSVGLITLLVAVAWAGLLLIFRPIIPADLYPLLWAALALFVSSAWYAILMDVLRGQEKSTRYTFISVSQSYTGIAMGLILVLIFETGIGGLIWGQTIGQLLAIVPLLWFTTRSVTVHPANIERAVLKQLWTFALPFTLGNVAFWSLSLSDRYVVSLFRSSYEVGLYSVASKISWRTVQLLVNLFFLVPAPTLCRLWEERGRRATEDTLTAFTRMFFLMIIPAVVGLSSVAAPLVRLLADEAYYAGYPAIWLVACASLMLGLTDLGITGCLVTNRTGLIAANQCLAAGAGLLLNFLLVPLFGFMGAALSAFIAFSLLAGLQAIVSARFLTWRWPLKSLWRVLAASALMYASVRLVAAVLPSATVAWQAASLLLSILAGALTYGAVLWLLGEISPPQLVSLLRPGRFQAAAVTAPAATGPAAPLPTVDETGKK